jgi:RND family efflux transporter MFP subunit
MNEKATLLNQLRIDRTTSNPPPKRTLLWASIAGAVVVAGLLVSWFVFAASNEIPVHAATAKAIASDAPSIGGSILDASGYVTPRFEATVSSNIIDRVISVPVEEGQHVEKGQLLAQLDDNLSKAQVAAAEAAVAQAEANLAAAKVAVADAEPVYQRDVKQLAQELISQEAFDDEKATYDAAKTAAEVAEQNLDAARAAVTEAIANDGYTRIYAPFDGVVTTVSAVPGNLVSYSFSAGGGIATVVDMNSLEVWVDVSENFINRVQAHQPAIITLNAYPDWEIPGEVIAVVPTADQAKATVKVRVAFKQRDQRVLPHMGARVAFLAETSGGSKQKAEAPAGVVVPTDAVQVNGDNGVVFVIKNRTVERRTVKLGGHNAGGQVVLSGLAPGDRVAVGDMSQLTDGARVKVE